MSEQMEMPRNQCHKKVWALKIKEIEPLPNPDLSGKSVSFSYGARITPEDPKFLPFNVAADYIGKHKPVAGGYFVVYEGGYRSFSPADVFESGYSRI